MPLRVPAPRPILPSPEESPKPTEASVGRTTVRTLLTVHPGASAVTSERFPRVQFRRSAPGTVTLIGMTEDGHWVGEMRCLSEAVTDSDMADMERRVRYVEQRRAMTPLRVIP